jgi:DNA-binding XRE family transcriptional regulator
MNKLKTYLAATKMRQSALAEVLEISRGHMSDLVNGAKQPGLELAFQIERATNGAVPAMSWVSIPDQPSQKAS